ncbi:MAG: hypothetical protein LBU78_08695 [Microbacterium sp.]|jgi:hypothetical protein|nr:hypothetical protein [Microbacterium sp.]
MTVLALVVALILLTALVVLQVLVAAGQPFGRLVWGGRHRVLPWPLRAGSLAVAVVYLGFGVLLLSRAGVLPGRSDPTVGVLTWGLFGCLALSVLANALSRSRAERWTMTPTSALLAAATFAIAVS